MGSEMCIRDRRYTLRYHDIDFSGGANPERATSDSVNDEKMALDQQRRRYVTSSPMVTERKSSSFTIAEPHVKVHVTSAITNTPRARSVSSIENKLQGKRDN